MSTLALYSSIVFVATLATLTTHQALAQDQPNAPECAASARDPARSIALFDEAARLYRSAIKSENLAELATACDNFEESQRLDPLAETLVNLAECRHAQGRIATAYSHLRRAAALARDEGNRKLEREAIKRANEIEADRSYMTIHVESRVPQLAVRKNGELVGEAQFEQRLPVDPNKYALTASAPGFASIEIPIEVSTPHDDKSVTVPALTPLPPAPPEQSHTASESPKVLTVVRPRVVLVREPQEPPHVWPWVLGGVGAAAVLVGGVSGALAIHDKHTISSACPQSPCANAHALSIQSRRDFEWTLARVTFPLGLVALGGAATWFALQPARSEQPKSNPAPNNFGAALDHHTALIWLGGSL